MALNEEIKEGEYYRSYDKPNQKWFRHYFFTTAKCVLMDGAKTLSTWASEISSTIEDTVKNMIVQSDSQSTTTAPSSKLFHDTVSTMQSNFQDGCNTIAAGVTSNGGTISKAGANYTPAEIVAGIATVKSAGASGGATGNATTADVLLNKTFSANGTSGQTGQMPNNGAKNYTIGSSDHTNNLVTIDKGYHSGAGKVTLNDSNLTAANIKSGVKIFGVSGSANVVDTSDGTLTNNGTAGQTNQMLNGYVAYSDGVKYTGKIASKGAHTYTPTTSNQTIAAGVYLSGAQTIAGDANLKSANIKSGVKIFGISGATNVVDTTDGTLTNNGTAGQTNQILNGYVAFSDGVKYTGKMPSNSNGAGTVVSNPNKATSFYAYMPWGYYPNANGSGNYANRGYVSVSDANLKSANIKSGVTIFGVSGNANVVDTSGGTVTANSQLLNGYKAYSDGKLYTGTANNLAGKTAAAAAQILSGYSAFGTNGVRIDGTLTKGYTGSKIIRITHTFNGDYGSAQCSGDTWVKSYAEVSIYVTISVTSSGITATILDDTSHSTNVSAYGYVVDRNDQLVYINQQAAAHRSIIGGPYLTIS